MSSCASVLRDETPTTETHHAPPSPQADRIPPALRQRPPARLARCRSRRRVPSRGDSRLADGLEALARGAWRTKVVACVALKCVTSRPGKRLEPPRAFVSTPIRKERNLDMTSHTVIRSRGANALGA